MYGHNNTYGGGAGYPQQYNPHQPQHHPHAVGSPGYPGAGQPQWGQPSQSQFGGGGPGYPQDPPPPMHGSPVGFPQPYQPQPSASGYPEHPQPQPHYQQQPTAHQQPFHAPTASTDMNPLLNAFPAQSPTTGQPASPGPAAAAPSASTSIPAVNTSTAMGNAYGSTDVTTEILNSGRTGGTDAASPGDLGKQPNQVVNLASHQVASSGDYTAPIKASAVGGDRTAEILSKFTEAQIDDAKNEHAEKQPALCSSAEEIKAEYGNSIALHFQFQKFVMLLTVVLTILALINYFVFVGNHDLEWARIGRTLVASIKGNSSSTATAAPGATLAPGNNSTDGYILANVTITAQYQWYSDFFISQYTETERNAWLATCVAALVVAFFACPFYSWMISRSSPDPPSLDEVLETAGTDEEGRKRIEAARAAEAQSEGSLVRFDADLGIDVAVHYYGRSHMILRRLGSTFLFLVFCALQVVASIYLTRASAEGSVGVSFAISIVSAVFNLAYGVVARKLNDLEHYISTSDDARQLALKQVCFKLANVMAVYGAKTYVDSDMCIYDAIGEQFMTLLLVEIVFTIPSAVVIAYFQTEFNMTVSKLAGNSSGNRANMAQFALSTEYLNVLYRFYIALMAMVVFPLSTVLSLVAFFFAFWTGKFRLFKICGDPGRDETTHRKSVAGGLMFMCLAALLTPNSGCAFILSGYTSDTAQSLCPFPRSGLSAASLASG